MSQRGFAAAVVALQRHHRGRLAQAIARRPYGARTRGTQWRIEARREMVECVEAILAAASGRT